MKTCTFEGCDKKHFAHGLCSGHYTQKAKGAELTRLRPKRGRSLCSFEGCGKPVEARGLCVGHTRQLEAGKELRAIKPGYSVRGPNEAVQDGTDVWLIMIDEDGNESGRCVVDVCDYPMISDLRWHIDEDNYAVNVSRNRTPQTVAMHRILMNAAPGVEIDHEDGNRLNNRHKNLRVATRAQNAENVVQRPERELPRNVYRTREGRFRVDVKKEGVSHFFGVFESVTEAAEMAAMARDTLFTHHNEGRTMNAMTDSAAGPGDPLV